MAASHEFVLREKPRGSAGQRLAISLGMALLGAALAFFVSMFLAIIVLLFIGFFRRVDMALAYRVIAVPVAAAALPIAFIGSLWWQSRQRRVPRT